MGCGTTSQQPEDKREMTVEIKPNMNDMELVNRDTPVTAPQPKIALAPLDTKGPLKPLPELRSPPKIMVSEHLMVKMLELKIAQGCGFDTQADNFVTNAQIQIQAPPKQPIKLTLKGEGKVQLVVVKPGDVFPLTQVTQIIQSTGQQNGECSIQLSCETIAGFVVFCCGQNIEFKMDSGDKMVLSATHVEPMP